MDQKSNGGVCSAQSAGFNAPECKRRVLTENTYCLSYWSHSWGGKPNEHIYKDKGLDETTDDGGENNDDEE
jgi:hypothetical protein